MKINFTNRKLEKKIDSPTMAGHSAKSGDERRNKDR